MIEDLMCRFQIDLPLLFKTYPDKWSQIETYIAGLLSRFPDVLVRRDDVVTLRREARMLIRIIAHDIDGFRANLEAHSMAV